MSTKIGVIVGRFQVPYLHPGHLNLIATALRECDKVLILLGSKDGVDDKNPYSIHQRIATIKRIFAQVIIIPLMDNTSDEIWSNYVDSYAKSYGDPILYYGRDSFLSSYTGTLIGREVETVGDYSGTKLRETYGK